jgi:type I restriction enzyme, S subunit
MSKWPRTRLGNVVSAVERPEAPRAGTVYRQIGVRLWGAGAYEREPLDGSQTKYSQLFRAETGDVIVNKIWARNGSVAVVSDVLSGCFGSSEFPMFSPDTDKVSSQWIHWLTKTRDFWFQCDEKSRGTSGQNRIKPEQFLNVEIPLPPLADQRRMVTQIEELAAQIKNARILREETLEEANALLTASRRAAISDSLGEVIALEDTCIAIIDNLHSNPQLSETGIPCIRSPDVGYGTLDLEGAQRTDKAEYRRRTARGEPRENDIVLVREGGGTGKCALVQPGQRFSLGQRVMMLRPNTDRIVPQFLLHQLLSPLVQEAQIAPLSKGSASPHLNIGALRRFDLKLPGLPEQRRVVAELDALETEISALRRVQAETAVELDALLPSILNRAFNEGI